ncbi:MAG: FdtA/QdtA family cupin domain-containing protein [Bacilli bacterium]
MSELFKVKTIDNGECGSLSIIEHDSNCEFDIKRVYYIHSAKKDSLRGFHAHHKLKQILICTYGSIDIELDDGKEKKVITLDTPSKALFLNSLVWRTMKWNIDNSSLIVLASDLYDESDYIRNYDDFLIAVENNSKNKEKGEACED